MKEKQKNNADEAKESPKKVKDELVYTDEQQQILIKVKEAADIAFNELLHSNKIPATPYSDHNAVIDLTTAINNGVEVYTPEVNRKHGIDQMKTGVSLRLDSPQTLLLVIPVRVAEAAGMVICRFDNDKHRDENESISPEGLVCINGNGRIDYILSLAAEDRPKLYATLVEPDSKGFINVSRAMSAINEYQSQWKTQDKLQKKILEAGGKADNNLKEIRKLVNSGYNYQAACQLVTLRPNRITSKELEKDDLKDLFKFAQEAKKIREALVDVFGEGEDKCLKNKAISLWVSEKFHLFLNKQENPAPGVASDQVVDFIKWIKKEKVEEIKATKPDKSKGVTRDSERLRILTEQFNRFIGQKGIDID